MGLAAQRSIRISRRRCCAPIQLLKDSITPSKTDIIPSLEFLSFANPDSLINN